MSIFDRFKGRKKNLIDELEFKPTISLYSINPSAKQFTTKEFPTNVDFMSLTLMLEAAKSDVHSPQQQPCDVFLCYNSEDKQAVLDIGDKLRKRGIIPWVDAERIIGGATFDEVIKQAVIESRSAAIFVGSAGFGRYQRYEIRAFLDAGMSERLRVIPVLLPSCDAIPESEIFLRQHHYVRFSSTDDRNALEQLIKAIRSV